MKHGSKTSKVLSYLQTGHSLDVPKATALWGHIRLSDAIFRLRNKGYPVQTEVVQSESSNVKFAIYRLPRCPNKDTPLGTKVRLLETVEVHGPREGVIVGFSLSSENPVDVKFATGDISFFDYNELEVIQ